MIIVKFEFDLTMITGRWTVIYHKITGPIKYISISFIVLMIYPHAFSFVVSLALTPSSPEVYETLGASFLQIKKKYIIIKTFIL